MVRRDSGCRNGLGVGNVGFLKKPRRYPTPTLDRKPTESDAFRRNPTSVPTVRIDCVRYSNLRHRILAFRIIRFALANLRFACTSTP
jgi:hypothetical protein